MLNYMPRSEFHISADTVFFEAICIIEGSACYPEDHIDRMILALRAAGDTRFSAEEKAKAYYSRALESVPDSSTGTWKLRFRYTTEKLIDTEIVEYSKKEITSFILRDLPTHIPLNEIYPLKFENRHYIQNCSKGLEATEEVILVYNGFITDAGYSALAFHRGGKWFTPDTPLLYSTSRNRELRSGRLTEASIRCTDLFLYDSICILNAMNPLGTRCFPTSTIHNLREAQERS
ncbi:hypothetical protein JCM12856_12410 [Spirochaeta dissipatitropha]